MREHWELAENNLWRKRWLFFWHFEHERASRLAYMLMQKAFEGFDGMMTVDEEKRIHGAIVDFIKKNSPRKWSMEYPYLCIGMQPAKDPRRFALKMSQSISADSHDRPVNAEVEWTYDYRPGSKIQGRQIDG